MSRILLYVVTDDFAFLNHRLPMARAARDAGFDVHVATAVGSKSDAVQSERFTLHAIPFKRGGISPIAILKSAIALRRLKASLKPDIIHHVGLQTCIPGGLSSLGSSTPQINAMTGLGYAFTGTSFRARVLKTAISLVLRFLLNRGNSITLVQNPDDARALADVGIDTQCIALIPGSGVDTDRLMPLAEPEGTITVGFAGRLLTEKGIRALVSAHRILRNRGMDIQLLIAGEPDPANPASVTREEAEQWNTEPGIRWLGHVRDIGTLWTRSHIAALPSHREGLPKTLLEAAAFGRPMVATDAPGCREICIHEQTGLLVPIEDPDALANAIGKLAASKELRRRYGGTARQLVVDKMSAKSVGTAIVALYEKAIRENGPH